ncbi:hypothetical protein OIU84_027797 [Salix udensis]|uniref:EF-hand domain-containing protein n=1 Tax=Salix udensis TaxID=889485 RepID=A0AAD6KGA9_9ROSI|nr:hypothetical protein OIU84_027797 [Salix udensis]
MEEIRRVAAAYYEHLPAKDKKSLRGTFKAMDKNRDGKISLLEYLDYFKKKNGTDFTHQSICRALDMNVNGSLDFEEAIVLFYIMESGRTIICMSCKTFMAGVYFSCSQCFFNVASRRSFDICCDCYGGKKFTHHSDAIFCDNFSLLSQSRSLALEASAEKRSRVVEGCNWMLGVANLAVSAGCIIM